MISLLTQTRLFRIRFCSVRVPSCHWPFQLGVGRGGGGGTHLVAGLEISHVEFSNYLKNTFEFNYKREEMTTHI